MYQMDDTGYVGGNSGLVYNLLNSKKPFEKDYSFSNNFIPITIDAENLDLNNYDSLIGLNVNEDVGLDTEYIVYKPEQIHTLGSKKDIEGFKNFVDNRPAASANKFELDIKNLNLTPEVVNYLYQDSRAKSQGRDIESYKREISKLINNLQSDFTNSEILETIKCI